MAPVALLQQCENGSTVPAVGVVEQRLHLREHHLSTNGGLREEGNRLAKEGVASLHKHIDTLVQSEQTHITGVRIELEKEAKWSPCVVPRSCAPGATLRLSKLCQCLKRPVDLVPFAVGVSVIVAVLVHLHREESHNPRVHRLADDVEQVGTALVRSVALTRTRSLVRAQHVTMVISAFVRPLHAVLVQHSRYQIIQNDILPPLVGWWWFASGNSRLFLQPYFASYAEAVSSVLKPPLGGELVPALVAAPCRGLCEVGVAVVAHTSNPPTGTDAGTSTARLLARTALSPMGTDAGTSTARLFARTALSLVRTDAGTSTARRLALTALPQMLTDAGTSTARLLAHAALPPMLAEASASTARLLAQSLAFSMLTDASTTALLATVLAFSMRTRFLDTFRLLCSFNTFFHQFRHELERVCGSLHRLTGNTIFHGLEIELGRVLVWELHTRNGVSVLEHAGIPSGPVCLSMLSVVKSEQIYFTIILQSSVGTLEGHSESVCIGRNRCATYTNHVITSRNHICKLAGS